MNFAIVLCTKRHSLTAQLLRLYMWSPWSHSAVLDVASGVVYDSTFRHGGVRSWALHEWVQGYPDHELRPVIVPAEKVEEARAWLDAQVGKPYDWSALFGIFFRHGDWQRPDAWFCSEHSESFRSRFESQRFRADLWRVTPAHQDMLV